MNSKPDESPVEHRVDGRRVALSLVLVFGQALGAVVWLKADGPVAWLFAYSTCIEGLFFLRYLYRRLDRRRDSRAWQVVNGAAAVMLGVLFAFGAAVIIVGLDITPASAYLAWFELVQEGIAGGTLAYMFSVKFVYFGALFGGLVLTGSAVASLLDLAAVDLLIVAVLFDKPGLSAIGAALFLLAIGRHMARRAGRAKGRAGGAMLQMTVIVAIIALPLWAAAPKNRLVDGLMSIRMETFVARLFPNFPFLYNVPGYGYSLASGEIGDSPVLTSRPVFQVTAPKGATVYIRTGVYDVYTGTGWELSDSGMNIGEQNVPLYETLADAPPRLLTEDISFKVLIDFYSSLPHVLGTVAFQFPGGKTPDAIYASLGSGFILNAPLRRGSSIVDLVARPDAGLKPIDLALGEREPQAPRAASLPHAELFSHGQVKVEAQTAVQRGGESLGDETLTDRFRSEGFDAAGEAAGRNAATGDDSEGSGRAAANWYSYSSTRVRFRRAMRQRLDEASPTYGLQLGRYALTPWERDADLQTGDLPAPLLVLAKRLGAGRTNAETIDAIRSYLIGNYQYSLNTKPGGPYDDAVTDFLFTSKKGYCVQFASAFVILARLNGIPARYVTGFLAQLPADSTEMTVTGLSAHAWAETWSSRRGWVTQEATPPMVAAEAGSTNVLQAYNPTDSAYTQRQLEAVLGGRLTAASGLSARPPAAGLPAGLSAISDRFAQIRSVAAVVAAALVTAALLVLLGFVLFTPAEGRLKRIVRRIAKRSRDRGLPDPAALGWREWSRELANRYPDRALVARRAAAVIHRSFFSGSTNGERHLHRDTGFLRRLNRRFLRGRRPSAKSPRREAPVA